MGSGCGSVGREVASNTRGSNPVIGKIDIEHLFVYWNEKAWNKEKEAGNGPF